VSCWFSQGGETTLLVWIILQKRKRMKKNVNSIGKMMIGIINLMLFSCYGYAALIVDSAPTTIIRDQLSELDRPEGVTFSPTGKYIATANSLVDTVTFYRRIGDSGSQYETTPAFSIQGKESKLNYPHDVAFSPDGLHLAVANRIGNSITIYKRNFNDDFYSNKPIAVIRGASSGVRRPDSVKYSPTNNIIAVANLADSSIAFYRYKGDVYEKKPYQIIQDTPDVLLVPDGLDFSVDGELLAVTSHDANAVLIYQKLQGSNGKYTSRPVEIIQGADTNLNYPHSVSFHPTKNYLLVSSSQGLKNINIFQKTSDDFPRYGTKPLLSLEITQMYDESTIHLLEELHQEGGCKGVAFSPDGKALAITQNLSADFLKLPYSVGVLLIYPVSIDDR
jgi:WD40 repeat protein